MKEYTTEKPIEIFFVEINLRSRKWLLSCSYNRKTNLIADHLHCIGRGIDFFSSKYDNFIVLGDLNTEVSNSFMEQFCASYNLKRLIKNLHVSKVLIILILTNHLKCFQNSAVYETGISDFHKLTFTALKTYFQKAKPRIIKYRGYKHFDNNKFRDELIRELYSNNMQSDDLVRFTNTSKMILEKKAPLKERYVRYNQAKFMNKILQKAIMNRSRLLSRYRKEKTEVTRSAYKIQRNFCVKLLRKTRKQFYNNLNVKYITENKLFWKTVKPLFTDKTLKDERITLLENNKVVSDESKLVEIFGKYFGNIVQNLAIDGLTNISSDNETVTLRKAIEKYQDHASIKVIRESIDTTKNFSFDLINPECIIKIINNLDTSKATQQGDIPTKIIKDKRHFFIFYFCKL